MLTLFYKVSDFYICLLRISKEAYLHCINYDSDRQNLGYYNIKTVTK